MKFLKEFTGEFIGTYFMVLFGCGAVATAVLFGEQPGILTIALIWGITIALGIYATRSLSCAHFNPAVSFAMVAAGRMKANKLVPYLLGQFIGAFIAALTLYALFSPSIAAFEQTHQIVRGAPESMLTAKMFGEFYQMPGNTTVSMGLACFAEGIGTFFLVTFIFFLTEGCNLGRPSDNFAPVMIGLTVSMLICLIAPLTQAGFNPARDFSPRMVAYMMGWKNAAFPLEYSGFFWVYICSPIVGGLLASLLFTKFIEPVSKAKDEKCCCCCENEAEKAENK